MGSTFHFHHTSVRSSPLRRPTPYAPSRAFSISPSRQSARDARRTASSASHVSSATVGLTRSGRRSRRRCRGVEDAVDKPFERGAAFALREGAHVVAVKLEEIVGDEGDRQFAHRLLAHHLAAEATLKARERLRGLQANAGPPRFPGGP